MLVYLQVKNIALIDEINLNLHGHLNIFSGETGAGKSMLIDSIQFAIGNRTSKQIIRKGEQSAYVKLVFSDQNALWFLEELGIPYSNNEIILERTLYISGRTVYKINNIISNRAQVKQLASLLIDIYGQHEPQSLLDPSKHLIMLDNFGDVELKNLKQEYQQTYQKWHQVTKEMENIEIDERKKLQLKDMLNFQIEEIEQHNFQKDEESMLNEQYTTLSHAEKILMQCQKAYEFLGEDVVGSAIQNIRDISHINTQLKEFFSQLNSIEAQLQDVTFEIRRYIDSIEYSPQLLQDVQNRLDVIYRMKQKYGNSIEEILQFKNNAILQLDEIMNAEENQQDLNNQKQILENQLLELAQQLSKKRKEIVGQIEIQIEKHLRDLQMPHAKFRVSIKEISSFNKNGKDDIEFMICTNLGTDVAPLAKIASGGEISRVMLAIKTIFVLEDSIGTVIFDEIDTGISGVTAQKVAEKLALISRNTQVICITHLPQICAMGDKNYLIEKNVVEEHTKTSLIELVENQIINELCRLMGGIITNSTKESAKEIKLLADKFKKNI
ncbi:DNA repair protein RecN [Candidatus Epulonipiscium fishelsonii]|uniref:DNA repair protein RecN n=1 Tax=Candidatus Epulonipiscium fishelsonii TaxID=77094 RepID=A0ACC8X7Q4_9FIRM|nr:DNA repair protein RecN [Epulopiscium sp. SCG-B11WGA-EpuloA1]ONI41331.1 DNA repair protein RecN [Epulopiscium sp. SCG-B05WGA-EpuloA1]